MSKDPPPTRFIPLPGKAGALSEEASAPPAPAPPEVMPDEVDRRRMLGSRPFEQHRVSRHTTLIRLSGARWSVWGLLAVVGLVVILLGTLIVLLVALL